MNEKIKKLLGSSASDSLLLKLVILLGLLIIVVVIFLAGEEIGERKAEFSYHFSDNYNRMFGGHMMAGDNTMMSAHGADGTIVKINLPTVIIEDKNNVEKIITVGTNSIIKELRDTIASTTLKVGDEIIVLGAPLSDGSVLAGLIRVLPVQKQTQSK